MEPITRFSLETHTGPYEKWPSRTGLLVAGAPQAATIKGYTLLHQFKVGNDYLLITDYDCPFEEAITFTLLDAQLRTCSHRTLGAPYASFLLEAVEVIYPRCLIATLYGGERWCLTIRDRGIPYLRPRLMLARYPDRDPTAR